jgi:hypothetical protein
MELPLSAAEQHVQDLEPKKPYATRLAAVRELGRLKNSTLEIVRALIAVKEGDPSYQMRQAAAETLEAPVHRQVLAQHPELLGPAAAPVDPALPGALPVDEAQPSPAKPLNPWLTVWIWPRRTIRQIVDADPRYRFVLLVVLAGFARGLDFSSNRSIGDTVSLPTIFLLAAIMGPIGWLIGVYIWGGLLRWTGSWLGGEANSAEVRAAVVWSGVPAIAILLIWIPIVALSRGEIFSSSMPTVEAQPLLALPLLGFFLIQIVLSLWSLGLSVLCLAEVHRFSVWRSLAAALLGAIIFIVPLACLLALMLTA